tara:strand:+ start:754 stop:927 length:174 start_codon:yes stop_codon:yes gene_type:complete
MKDILDRLIGAGKTHTIEGALILTILFGDKIPGDIVNEIVIIIGSLLAIYKFYAKKG